ncbi:MAG: hypothetical protein RBR24_08625 [Candidatus Carbobacillus sp.]|nr:hypothetical protein [Candidatus Carbobacillus sp.]
MMSQFSLPIDNKAYIKVLGILIIGLSLVFIGGSLGRTSSSDTSGEEPISDVLSLDRDVTLFVTGVYAVPNEKGLDTVSIIFKLRNESATTFDFYPYWLRITANGITVPVELLDADQTQVMARSERYFIFYTQLPQGLIQSIGLKDDVSLRLIRWDTTSPDFEKTIGTLHIDGEKVSRLLQAQTSHLPWPAGRLYASIEYISEQISEHPDDHEKSVQYRLHLLNTGRTPQPYPSLIYGLVTADGIFYPLTLDGDEPTQLLPNLKTSLTLIAHVPSAVELHSARIYLLKGSASKESVLSAVPLTALQATAPSNDTSENRSDIHAPTENIILRDGAKQQLELRLSGLPKRMPEDMSDLFTALLQVYNTGEEAVELPEWESFLKTEAGQIFPIHVMQIGTQKTLYPGQQAYFVLNGQLPYDLMFNQGELQLTPRRPAQGLPSPIWKSIRYIIYDDLLNVSITEKDVQPILSYPAYQLNIRVIERRNYPGLYDDVVSTVLEVDNDTLRPIPLPKLYGSYVLSDGRVYKTAAFEGEGLQTIEPLGKAVIELYTLLSNGQERGLNLLLAPYLSEVTSEKASDGNGIGEPIGLRVPDQAIDEKPEKGVEVDLYPLHLWLSGSKKDGELSYRLEVKKRIAFAHDAHELVIDFFDQNGSNVQSIPLDIKKNGGEIAIPKEASYFHLYDRILGHERLLLMNTLE